MNKLDQKLTSLNLKHEHFEFFQTIIQSWQNFKSSGKVYVWDYSYDYKPSEGRKDVMQLYWFINLKDISEYLGISLRKCERYLNELEKAEVFKKQYRQRRLYLIRSTNYKILGSSANSLRKKIKTKDIKYIFELPIFKNSFDNNKKTKLFGDLNLSAIKRKKLNLKDCKVLKRFENLTVAHTNPDFTIQYNGKTMTMIKEELIEKQIVNSRNNIRKLIKLKFIQKILVRYFPKQKKIELDGNLYDENQLKPTQLNTLKKCKNLNYYCLTDQYQTLKNISVFESKDSDRFTTHIATDLPPTIQDIATDLPHKSDYLRKIDNIKIRYYLPAVAVKTEDFTSHDDSTSHSTLLPLAVSEKVVKNE